MRVRGRSATRILLPPVFSSIVSELGLDGLLLRLQGGCQSPSYVELEVDSSHLTFLGSGWSLFSRRLNLREGDMLWCHFDGESPVAVRVFDPSGNNMDPHWQGPSGNSSGRSRSPTLTSRR